MPTVNNLKVGDTTYTIEDATSYAHAVTNKGSAFSSGLYKITTNSEGHVTAATAVVKADITALGIPAQDTVATTMTGATSSVDGAIGLVPAPLSTDYGKFLSADGTWQAVGKPMVVLSYGTSTWQQFLDAYNNNVIVYCRASSNSDPSSGAQTRMAFMAYVNANPPTEVEFQYYRSVSSHTSSQYCDQVFIYKLNSEGTWSVTSRYVGLREIKVNDNSNMSISYSSNRATINGIALPAVTSSDNGKILQVVDGVWTAVTPS